MKSLIKLGQTVAYILRHNPSSANLTLDENGWADTAALIKGTNESGIEIDFAVLCKIVATDDKNRYEFNADKTKIRAVQGHSVQVDAEMKQAIPPDILYHGTAERFLQSIKNSGILKMTRLYVQLSKDEKTAFTVGRRHGKPVVLVIDTAQMVADGYIFRLSANGIWQSQDIPWRYVKQIITE